MSGRPGVEVYHLSVDMSDLNTMRMLYQIGQGCVKEQHYGLALARVVDLPPKILAVAEKVSESLIAQTAAKRMSSRASATNKRRKLLRGLKEHLEQLRDSPMDNQTLLEWVKRVRQEFINRMESIENEKGDIDSDPSEDGRTDEANDSLFSEESRSEETLTSDGT